MVEPGTSSDISTCTTILLFISVSSAGSVCDKRSFSDLLSEKFVSVWVRSASMFGVGQWSFFDIPSLSKSTQFILVRLTSEWPVSGL